MTTATGRTLRTALRAALVPALLAALVPALVAGAATAAPARPQGDGLDADLKTAGGYTLTVALLEKAAAVHEKMLVKALADPKAAAAMQLVGGGHTLAESAQQLEQNPVLAPVLKEV